MSDRSRFDLDVDEALAEWHAQTSDLAALSQELAEEREVIGIIARERDDLRRDNTSLRLRIDKAKDERDRAQRALRQPSVWGALVALWDVITGRQ